MIELIFVACLAGEPENCSQRSLLYTDITPRTCILGAQPELAKWIEQRPGMTIAGWRCQKVITGSAKI